MLEDLLELLKRRGFLWPSFEIYGGVGGFYDFGPLGASLKENLIAKWKKMYVWEEGYLELDSPSIVPFSVLKASGHVDHFMDLMGRCVSCGESVRMSEYVKERAGVDIEGMDREGVEKLLREKGIRCKCGGEFSLSNFNIMFATTIGPGSKLQAFLRPETAQQIFISFKRLFRHGRGRLPLGVVTVGKGYRNEISPRQGLIRLREFTMAEAEVFFDPQNPRPPEFDKVKDEKLSLLRANGQKLEITVERATAEKVVCNEMMAYHLALARRFLISTGISADMIRFREQRPEERAHYSSETWDMEVLTKQYGWVEVAGIAYRTDYDLSRHSSMSGEDLSVTLNGRKFYPHVVEPSFGIDRIFYCVLEHAYTSWNGRKFLRLSPELAPLQVGVFPLVSKDGIPEKAEQIYRSLKGKFRVFYDESGSIGRRYMRADEIGVPYCVTVDYQTLEDGSVTIRDRDTTAQIRVVDVVKTLDSLLAGETKFEEAGMLVRGSEERESNKGGESQEEENG